MRLFAHSLATAWMQLRTDECDMIWCDTAAPADNRSLELVDPLVHKIIVVLLRCNIVAKGLRTIRSFHGPVGCHWRESISIGPESYLGRHKSLSQSWIVANLLKCSCDCFGCRTVEKNTKDCLSQHKSAVAADHHAYVSQDWHISEAYLLHNEPRCRPVYEESLVREALRCEGCHPSPANTTPNMAFLYRYS
jgi:hypothetical protein